MKPYLLLFALTALLGQQCWAREQHSFVDLQRPLGQGSNDDNQNSKEQCEMDDNILVLQWNADKKEYAVVEDDDRRRQLLAWNANRQLRGEPRNGKRQQWARALHADLLRHLVEESGNQEEAESGFLVRSCRCGDLEPVYCPLDLGACSIVGHDDGDGNVQVGCFEATKKNEDLAQTCFFLSIVWFILLFCCLCCTECGRVIIHFLRSKSDATHNERLADFLLQHRRHRAFLLMQRNVYHHRWLTGSFHRGPPLGGGGDDDDKDLPTSLALKTHVFYQDDDDETNKMQSHHGEDDDDDDHLDFQCIICFQQFQNGDRVGDLLCGHVFHADCLKTWLPRRNACPLCNATNVATPLYCGDDDDDSKPNRPRAQTQSTASEDGTIIAQLPSGGAAEPNADEEASANPDESE